MRVVALGVLAALTALPLAFGCSGNDQRGEARPEASRQQDARAESRGRTSGSDRRPSGCPVTPPNHEIPPGQEDNPGADTAAYYGNGQLWTVLPERSIIREAPRGDGSIREKFPWWRGVRGPLTITGRRLNGPGPRLRARVPEGYGATGFQSSGIIFPSEGCWRVTGTVGEANLTFVTLVLKA